MEYIIENEEYDQNGVNNVKIKTLRNPDSIKTSALFLNKEQREKLIKQELINKREEEKFKESIIIENKKKYISQSKSYISNLDSKNFKDKKKREFDTLNNTRKKLSRSRSRSRSKEIKGRRENNLLPNSQKNEFINLNLDEKEAIKNYYLGLTKEKKKLIKPSDKFKNIFNFEWDPSEDTSRDINPLYSHRQEPNLIFGKGVRGGIDKSQKDLEYKYDKRKINDIKDEKIKDISSKHWSNKPIHEMNDRDWRIFREDNDIIIKGGRVPRPIRSWEESRLPDFLFEAIKDAGYKMPTPIQIQGIPIGLERRDLIGLAPTGSGKSAAFLIPLIVYLTSLPNIDSNSSNDGPFAMILAPSRELSLQIFEEFNKFAKYTKLRAVSLVGGRSSEEQALLLGMGVEIIIGTPGRIKDALERHYTSLNQCQYVVLDEADTMIKEGFEESLNYILDCIPISNLKSEEEKLAEEQEKECKLGLKKFRITMMFSATMNANLEKLARKFLRCPAYITIGEPGSGKKEIDQRIEYINENQKRDKLRSLLNKYKSPIIIFVNLKKTADTLYNYINKYGYKVTAFHSGKSQEGRERALNSFKDGKFDILVTTNLAARGIDVENVTLVINYDAPTSIEDYNHRIGRTGRADKKGIAVTFLTNSDEKIFYDLREYLEFNGQHVPSELANHPASKIKPGSIPDNVPRRKQIVYTA